MFKRISGSLVSVLMALGVIFVPIAGGRTAYVHGLSGKITAPIDLVISGTPVSASVMEINLQVTPHIDAPMFNLSWELSPGINLVAGQLQSQENEIRAESVYSFQISVEKTGSDTLEKVVAAVDISGLEPEEQFGGLATLFLGATIESLVSIPESQAEGMSSALDALPVDDMVSSKTVEPLTLHMTSQVGDAPDSMAADDSVSAQGVQTITVNGGYVYLDHPASLSGVAAAGTQKAVRLAYLEVQKKTSSGWSKIASGHTKADGSYSLSVARVNVGSDKLRTRFCTKGPENDKLKVTTPGGALDCYVSQELTAAATTDFGWRTPFDTEAGGGPVNIYDTLLYGYQFVTQAASTNYGLTVLWESGYSPSCGSCFSPGQDKISLNGTSSDGDQWDDAVILHEMGHWVMNRYAASPPNSGGAHSQCNLSGTRPNLAYSEGWASFFGSAARRSSSDSDLSTNSNYYIDTMGGIGTTHIGVSWNLETKNTVDSATGKGNWCEYAVATTLWDVFDPINDDTLTHPFSDIFTAFRTKYNGAYPYNINQWWYGWTNTLGNRNSNSFGDEGAMLVNFANHSIDVGVKFVLTWIATPRDLDSHLWLPSSKQYHVRWNNKGNQTAFPYAQLDYDIVSGYGPETIWITTPYKGDYIYAAFDWTDQSLPAGIAGTSAVVKVYDANYVTSPLYTYTVPIRGTGDWWYVLKYAGATGKVTKVNKVQVASPGSYSQNPSKPGDEGEGK